MQSTDTFKLGHLRDRLLIFLQSMPHHMFMNRFYISCGGQEGGGFTGEKATTPVQDCVSTFVNVKPTEMFKETFLW